MTPATKLTIVHDMYDAGLLCKCSTEMIEPLDEPNTFIKRLVHDENCLGVETMKSLLNEIMFHDILAV